MTTAAFAMASAEDEPRAVCSNRSTTVAISTSSSGSSSSASTFESSSLSSASSQEPDYAGPVAPPTEARVLTRSSAVSKARADPDRLDSREGEQKFPSFSHWMRAKDRDSMGPRPPDENPPASLVELNPRRGPGSVRTKALKNWWPKQDSRRTPGTPANPDAASKDASGTTWTPAEAVAVNLGNSSTDIPPNQSSDGPCTVEQDEAQQEAGKGANRGLGLSSGDGLKNPTCSSPLVTQELPKTESQPSLPRHQQLRPTTGGRVLPPLGQRLGGKTSTCKEELMRWELSLREQEETKAVVLAYWSKAVCGTMRAGKEEMKTRLEGAEQELQELREAKQQLEEAMEVLEMASEDQKAALYEDLNRAAWEIQQWGRRESEMQWELERMREHLEQAQRQVVGEQVNAEQLQARVYRMELQQKSLFDKFKNSSASTRSLLVSHATVAKEKSGLQVRLRSAEQKIAATEHYNRCLEDLNAELEAKLATRSARGDEGESSQRHLWQTKSVGNVPLSSGAQSSDGRIQHALLGRVVELEGQLGEAQRRIKELELEQQQATSGAGRARELEDKLATAQARIKELELQQQQASKHPEGAIPSQLARLEEMAATLSSTLTSTMQDKEKLEACLVQSEKKVKLLEEVITSLHRKHDVTEDLLQAQVDTGTHNGS